MKKRIRPGSKQSAREKKVYKKRKRRRYYLKARNFYKNRPKEKRRKKRRKIVTRPAAPAVLILPVNFSFIDNPNEILETFAKFKQLANDGIPVILDFRKAKRITPDIIPLLLAKVYKYNRLTRIAGTRPTLPELDLLLLESGFYKMVGLTNYKSERGILDTHKNKVVNREVAVAARRLTAEKTLGDENKKIRPLYRTLIECMANTRKHASGEEYPRESWWLSVYYDPVTRITSFSFCDTGIGIFKSTKLERITKFALKLGFRKNKEILMRILEGRITSSTGLPYRGKGLPKIYNDFIIGSLKKLYIAANDTFADFEAGTFIDLSNELNGTFLYWEIHP